MPSQRSPLYPRKLVQAASIIRVAHGKAREAVRERLLPLRGSLSDVQASQYVRAMVRGLRPGEFVETREQVWAELRPVRADIYGVRNAAGDWYLKFYLLNGEVAVVSCHPPQWPLQRVDGLRIGGPKQ